MKKVKVEVLPKLMTKDGARVYREPLDHVKSDITVSTNTRIDQWEPNCQHSRNLHFRIHPTYYTNILGADHVDWLKGNGLTKFAQPDWTSDRLEKYHMLEFYKGFSKEMMTLEWRGQRLRFQNTLLDKYFT